MKSHLLTVHSDEKMPTVKKNCTICDKVRKKLAFLAQRMFIV